MPTGRISRHGADWHRLDSLPATPETVARYISDRAKGGKLKAGSIQRRVSAIAAFHQTKGLDSPTSSGQVKFIDRRYPANSWELRRKAKRPS